MSLPLYTIYPSVDRALGIGAASLYAEYAREQRYLAYKYPLKTDDLNFYYYFFLHFCRLSAVRYSDMSIIFMGKLSPFLDLPLGVILHTVRIYCERLA